MSLNISSEIRQLDLLSRNFRNSHLQTEERNLLKGCLSKQLGKIEILFNNFNNYKANRASCSDFYKHIKENIQLSKDKELIDKIQRIDHILNKHETTLNLPPFIQKALAEMGLKGSNTLQEHLVNELKNLLSRQETANEGHQLAELIITHRGSIEPENDSHLINQLFNVYFGENLTKNNDNRQSLMMLIHETPIEERDNLIQKILSTSDSLDQIFEITNNFPNEQKRAVLIFMLYFDISLVNQLHLDLTANPERITIEHILSYCFTNLDYLNSNPTFSREVFKEWIISSQFNHSKDLHAFKFKIKDWDENKKKSFLQGIDHAVFWLKDIQNPKTRREFLSSTPPNSYFAFGESLTNLILETHPSEQGQSITRIRTSINKTECLSQMIQIEHSASTEEKRSLLLYLFHINDPSIKKLYSLSKENRVTEALHSSLKNLPYLASNPILSKEIFKEWLISNLFDYDKALAGIEFSIKDWDENKKKSFLRGISPAIFWLKDIQDPSKRREFLSSTPPNSYFAFGEALTNLIGETPPSEQGQSITRIRTSINKTECLSQMIQIEHSASTEEKRSLLLYLFHINDPSIKKLYSLSKENRVTEALHSSLKNLSFLASNPTLSKEIFKEWLISNQFDYDKALAGIEFSIKDWDENKKKSFLRGISLAIFWLKDIQDPSKRREFLSSTPPNSYFAFGEALTNLIGETPPSEQNQLTTGIRNFIKKTGCLSLMIHIENSALIEQKKTFLLFMFHSDDTFIKKLYSIPTEDRMTSSINFFLENSKNLELLVTNPILFKEWIISTKYNLKGQRHGHKKQVAIFLKEIKKLDENKKKLIPKNLDDIIDYIDSVEKTEKRRQLLYFLTSNNNLEFLELLEDIPALEFLQTSSQLRNETNESAKVLLAEVFSNGVIKRANTTIITLNQLLKAWIATRFFKNVENPANRQAIMSFLSNIPQENLLPLFKNVLSLETHPVSEELDTIAEDFTYFRKQLRPFGPEFKDLTDPEGAMLSKALDKIFENFSFQSHSTPFRLFILSTLLEMTKKNIVLTKGLEEIYSYLNLKISSLQENPSQSPSLIPLVETLIHFHKDFKMELPTENSYLRNLCDIIALNEISNQNQIRISKILQKLSIKDLPTFVLAVSTLNTSNDLESDKVALWEAIDHYGFDLSKEALSLLGNNVSLEAFISAIDSIQKIPPMNS